MSARIVPLRPGDKVGEWTLLELRTDAPSARERKWLVQCSCGCSAFRAEHHLRAKTHSVVCGACTSARAAAERASRLAVFKDLIDPAPKESA